MVTAFTAALAALRMTEFMVALPCISKTRERMQLSATHASRGCHAHGFFSARNLSCAPRYVLGKPRNHGGMHAATQVISHHADIAVAAGFAGTSRRNGRALPRRA